MNPSSLDSQRGAALVVSLVLLVAITLIGVFVMSSSHLEWLMSSNSRFQTDAEMRAEAALVDGEEDVKTIIADATTFAWATPDAYYASPLPADPRNIANWVSPGTFITVNAATIPPAKYLIEYMGCTVKFGGGGCQSPGTISINTYRIWAYAADSKGASRIVQSTFADTVSVPLPPPPGVPPGSITHSYSSAFAQIDHDQPPSP